MDGADLTIDFYALYECFNQMVFPFLRFSAFFWFMPLYSSSTLIFTARIGLSGILAYLSVDRIEVPDIDLLSILGVLICLEQILFSMMFALFLHFFFQVFKFSGGILSSQMGLSMASMTDPTSGDSEPLLSQLFYFLAIFLFFSMGMHWITLNFLMQSFTLWPIGSHLFDLNVNSIVPLMGWVISTSLALVFPVVISLLMINVAFGLLGKASPSFNIFSMGFSIVTLMGFFFVSIWLSQSLSTYEWVGAEMLTRLKNFIGQ